MTEPNSPANNSNKSGRSNFAPGVILADRYKVERVLGVGGMGVVYKVEQVFLHKIFAMKTLEIEDVTGLFQRRFQQEGAAVSRLDHPNVIRIHDFGLINGEMPFYVMDFIDGVSLADLLKKRGSLEIADALKIFIRVSMALQHAHEAGIVHRDIKPSNIMLQNLNFESDNCVKIVDFGIAKLTTEGNEIQNLTRTGDIFGSPLYMSPEQCLGIGVDHRTDIYSFGCALYESLTGSPPHVGESSFSTMIKHREQAAPTLSEGSLGKSFPPALEGVVQQLLRKDPDERYQSFGDVTDDLVALSNNKKLAHATPSRSVDTKKLAVAKNEVPRESNTALLLTIPLITIAILGGFAWYALRPAPKPQAMAKPVPVTATPAPAAETNTAQSDSPQNSPEIKNFYHDRQLEYKDEPLRAYNHEDKYSHLCTDSQNHNVRVFQFPNKFAIGRINYGHKTYLAQGDVLVTEMEPFEFTTTYECCERPSLLDGFKPDEVGELDVSHYESATDEILSHINDWTKLYELNVGETNLTDHALTYLTKIKSIVDLRTNDSSITGKGIAGLKFAKQLQRLDVNYIAQPEYILKALRGSNAIQQLSMRRCKLTDDDLKLLSSVTSLHHLDLSDNADISDQGLQSLNLPNLTSLGIRQCNITEASFPFLASLPYLRKVSVGDTWSREREEKFRQMLPKVRLARDSGLSRVAEEMNK